MYLEFQKERGKKETIQGSEEKSNYTFQSLSITEDFSA